MKISIIGTGYVGLVTGVILADFGNIVSCVDIEAKKIDRLKKGDVPFYEPGLDELVKKNLEQKRLTFTTQFEKAISDSEIIFICVGTPSSKNGKADLTFLKDACKKVAQNLNQFSIIVIKSTVPLGTDALLHEIISKNTNFQFSIASCPEFLREGSAIKDAREPDRIVIGANDSATSRKLLELFKPFGGKRLTTDIKSAQMVKYAANCLLATKISYANAIAIMCEKSGADVESVLSGVGMDYRLGHNFLNPGVGFGGSCFPKDLSAFISQADEYDYNFELLKAVQKINQHQILLTTDKIIKFLDNPSQSTVAILGLSFKPDTDDIRESPAIKIIKKLQEIGVKEIRTYDPIAMPNAKEILKDSVTYTKNPYKAARGADILVIVTEWNEFKSLDFSKLKRMMKKAVILDGRNIYDPETIKKQGFEYQGIGRR